MYRNEQYSSSIKQFYDANEGFYKGNLDRDNYQQYRNYKPEEINAKNKKNALLLFIQKCDFAINDLNLYLDIYENDEALKLKNFYVAELKKAIHEYEKEYGPLCNYNESKKYVWNIQSFPWEE